MRISDIHPSICAHLPRTHSRSVQIEMAKPSSSMLMNGDKHTGQVNLLCGHLKALNSAANGHDSMQRLLSQRQTLLTR